MHSSWQLSYCCRTPAVVFRETGIPIRTEGVCLSIDFTLEVCDGQSQRFRSPI